MLYKIFQPHIHAERSNFTKFQIYSRNFVKFPFRTRNFIKFATLDLNLEDSNATLTKAYMNISAATEYSGVPAGVTGVC